MDDVYLFFRNDNESRGHYSCNGNAISAFFTISIMAVGFFFFFLSVLSIEAFPYAVRRLCERHLMGRAIINSGTQVTFLWRLHISVDKQLSMEHANINDFKISEWFMSVVCTKADADPRTCTKSENERESQLNRSATVEYSEKRIHSRHIIYLESIWGRCRNYWHVLLITGVDFGYLRSAQFQI